MKVIIACEESQVVTIAFRERGHEAYSCDLQECSGGHPEWHIREDILTVLIYPEEINGMIRHSPGDWDLMIAFPPCPYLTVSANKHYKIKPERYYHRIKAAEFFIELCLADIPKIAIENPIGVMSGFYRKPDQIIQPWMFGHGETKATCLWLKNLPKLKPTNIVDGREGRIWKMPPSEDRSKLRSKTFPGIAKAFAIQYGAYMESKLTLEQWNKLDILEKNRIFAEYV